MCSSDLPWVAEVFKSFITHKFNKNITLKAPLLCWYLILIYKCFVIEIYNFNTDNSRKRQGGGYHA